MAALVLLRAGLMRPRGAQMGECPPALHPAARPGPDISSPFSPQLSSGGPFSVAPLPWRPSPIGAFRPGRATVPRSRATAVPRLHLCTGQVSELSVSSCWVSFLQPTCILDQPWTIHWLQPSLSMATGGLDRL